MKKKKEVKFICSLCGKEPEKNLEKSNENWSVYDNKPCKFCGGALTFKIIDNKKE